MVTLQPRVLRCWRARADFLEKPVQREICLMLSVQRSKATRRPLGAVRERTQIAELVARLTPREHEVFSASPMDCNNREIAAELGISPRTVEVHRAALDGKNEGTPLADCFACGS